MSASICPGVDLDDYTRWKTNFGQSNGSGAGATTAAVPELTFVANAVIVLVIGVFNTRRRFR